MKRPAGLRWVVGQPVVTLAAMGGGLFCLYLWYREPGLWFVGIAALMFMGWVMKAQSDVAAYKAWKREWDSMAPGGARPRSRDAPGVRALMAMAVFAVLGAGLYGLRDDPNYPVMLGLLVGVVGLWLLGGLVRLMRRGGGAPSAKRARPAERQPVAICVRGPLIKVPDLSGAYRSLPEHCRKVLGAGRI